VAQLEIVSIVSSVIDHDYDRLLPSSFEFFIHQSLCHSAQAARLVSGFPPRRPGFAPGSGQVEFVVKKLALGQFFFEYLGSPSAQSLGAGTIGQKWPTCRVDSVWTPPLFANLKKIIIQPYNLIDTEVQRAYRTTPAYYTHNHISMYTD
jgi:hypothetical protein